MSNNHLFALNSIEPRPSIEIQDCYVDGTLYANNISGFYSESYVNFTTSTGPWQVPQTGTFIFSKNNNVVNVTIPQIQGNQANATSIAGFNTVCPTGYRPISTGAIWAPILTEDGVNLNWGLFKILNTGVMTCTASPTGGWTQTLGEAFVGQGGFSYHV